MSSVRPRPLKVGVVLPQVEGMMAGGAARWSDLLSTAQIAEASGFDSVWAIDHFLFPPREPGGQPLGCWECGSLLGALAALSLRCVGPAMRVRPVPTGVRPSLGAPTGRRHRGDTVWNRPTG